LYFKTRIKQEGNFELSSRTFVVHVNLSSANCQATIIQITVGSFVQNPEMELIEVLQQYHIASQEKVIFARA